MNRRPATRPLTFSALTATAAKHRASDVGMGLTFLELRAQECEALAAKVETFELALDARCAWCTDREQIIMRAAQGVELGERDWGMNVSVS